MNKTQEQKGSTLYELQSARFSSCTAISIWQIYGYILFIDLFESFSKKHVETRWDISDIKRR